MTPQRAILLAATFLLATLPASAEAREARFAEKIEAADRTLVLNGVGLCEWGILEVNIYHAALWLEVPCSDPDAILAADAAKHVELEFCRTLSQKQMRKAYRASFDENATDEEKETYGKLMAEFIAALGEGKKGSRLAMTHIPGEGLLLQQGDKKLGPMGDDGFARLLFRLYLGPKPPTKQLRRQLLADHPKPESLHLPAPEKEGDASDAKKEKPAPATRPKSDA